MAAFEPAPEGWSPDAAMEVGGAATNGAAPTADGVGEGESAPTA